MTKEQLYKEIVGGMGVSYAHKKALDDFFDSNVCIPKGENRHPYADVLHKMAEDMTKSFQVKYIHQDLGWSTFDSYTDYAFREKPHESGFEYQWLMTPVFNGTNSLTPYMTDNEFKDAAQSRGHKYIKIEETKRVRQ